MMATGWTIVLDLGKSLSKATLWDEAGRCMTERTRPNSRLGGVAGRTLDALGTERWLHQILTEFARLGPVGSIVPVAHGAAAALIREDRLEFDPLDYEWDGVAQARAAYDRLRDPFEATGSPALPAGLNLGLQLYWLDCQRTRAARASQILPWPQYWAWLLCGVAASEVTSLGCHTDLWRPYARAPSELAARRGWAERLAPLTPAGAVLGTLAKPWAARTGLSERVEVYCGLHDSNAALFAAHGHPALQGHDTTVLSTGTWFVAMRSPSPVNGTPVATTAGVFNPANVARNTAPMRLPEHRDCLLNVDLTGAPVPSARFMGGRELEILIGAHAELDSRLGAASAAVDDLASAMRAIENGEMFLPSWVPGVGPFPTAKHGRIGTHACGAEAPAYLYAALVAHVALDLIGSRDTLVIDGRFSRAPLFVRALAALRPHTRVFISKDQHGVARGALRLVNRAPADAVDALAADSSAIAFEPVSPLPGDLSAYHARWRELAEDAG
jgi:sugar (pentulose or hexulose) kinase